MWFYLGEILLYRKMLASKQTILLLLVYIQRSKCINEKIYQTVMVVPLDQNAGRHRDALLLGQVFLLIWDILLWEVVHEDWYTLVFLGLECEFLRDHMLVCIIECAHWPWWVTLEEFVWLCVTLLQSWLNVAIKEMEHLEEATSHSLHILLRIILVTLS